MSWQTSIAIARVLSLLSIHSRWQEIEVASSVVAQSLLYWEAARFGLPREKKAAAIEGIPSGRRVASLDAMFVPLERDVPRVAKAASHQVRRPRGRMAGDKFGAGTRSGESQKRRRESERKGREGRGSGAALAGPRCAVSEKRKKEEKRDTRARGAGWLCRGGLSCRSCWTALLCCAASGPPCRVPFFKRAACGSCMQRRCQGKGLY